MKKQLIAGAVAALCLTALTAQRASAQYCPPQCMRGGEISVNTGITLGLHWTPCKGHWTPNCPPPCYGPYGYPPPYACAQPPAPQPGPGGPGVPPPPPAPKAPPTAVQNIGYDYPASYDPNYAYNYGVPYYQDPGYWYGYGYGQ